jgi:hypothetical protein
MTRAATCVKCGGGVGRSARGRPRAYCSTACRRAAEYELRRVQGALDRVEEQIRWCRFGWNGRTERDIPRFEEERLRLETRLRKLLSGYDEKETTP